MEKKINHREEEKPLTDLGKPTKKPNNPSLSTKTITKKKEK
ncbi:hypothetical protein [Aquimarina sp. U1-2]|nr:hypothetical protein [Aquimarina sp. U1-2]